MEVSQTLYQSHYSNKHQILLVGEGDFRISLCLARAFGSATNITVTSLDTREELELKCKNVKSNVEELERLGCTVVHGVNVHCMNTDYRVIRSILYDRIIFDFPHAGFHFGREHEIYTIFQHQAVVRGFLRSAREMVKKDGGGSCDSHKTAHPFTNWNLRGLGIEEGLVFYSEMKFDTLQYPGYINKRGSGRDSDSDCDSS